MAIYTLQVELYRSPTGQEHVRVEYPDGSVEHFEGPDGHERKVCVVYADGRVETYEPLAVA